MYKIEGYKDGTRILGITKEELDLDKTLNCGQAFRWDKLRDNDIYDEAWCGVIGNDVVLLNQTKFDDNNIEGLFTNLDVNKAKCLIDYLDLNMEYTSEIGKLDLDEYASKAYEYGKGIHILRQDLAEVIITFLLSSCNSMNKIRDSLERLSLSYGERLTYKGIVRFSFPTLEQLKSVDTAGLEKCKTGFRAKYILDMIEYMNNSNILEELKQCSNEEAVKILTSRKGIGPKIANCISLFGLHHVEAFPIDTHIKQIIDNQYNGHIDLSRYGAYAGIIQQYMFYYKAFKMEV